MLCNRLFTDGLDGGLICSVELTCYDLNVRIEGIELSLVRLEMSGGIVADIDRFGRVVGILMRSGSANAQWRIATWGISVSTCDTYLKVCIPVIIMTFPLTRSPAGMSATCLIPGRPSNSGSSGMPSVNCLLSACSLRFAAAPAILMV